MAVYYCEECDHYKDGDYFPCVEHPTQAEAFCCEACAERIEEECRKEREKDKEKINNE